MQTAFFLKGGAGRLLCTAAIADSHPPERPRCLIIPPFAEEMNKSRHVLAALLRGLARSGYDALLPDLYGTGDSAGDFGEATLDIWREDIDAAIHHLNANEAPVHLLGLRFGALLAADACDRHRVVGMTLMHPMTDGRQQLTQMLRLRMAASMAAGEKESTGELKERLNDGEVLEIAGYRLSPALADGMQDLSLAGLRLGRVGRIAWIEVAPQQDRPLMPASQRIIEAWQREGKPVTTRVIACDQFWSTQEIAACPDMVSSALACIGEAEGD